MAYFLPSCKRSTVFRLRLEVPMKSHQCVASHGSWTNHRQSHSNTCFPCWMKQTHCPVSWNCWFLYQPWPDPTTSTMDCFLGVNHGPSHSCLRGWSSEADWYLHLNKQRHRHLKWSSRQDPPLSALSHLTKDEGIYLLGKKAKWNHFSRKSFYRWGKIEMLDFCFWKKHCRQLCLFDKNNSRSSLMFWYPWLCAFL